MANAHTIPHSAAHHGRDKYRQTSFISFSPLARWKDPETTQTRRSASRLRILLQIRRESFGQMFTDVERESSDPSRRRSSETSSRQVPARISLRFGRSDVIDSGRWTGREVSRDEFRDEKNARQRNRGLV